MSTLLTNPTAPATVAAPRSALRGFWRGLRRSPVGMVGLLMLLVVLVLALFAPLIAAYDPYAPPRLTLDTVSQPPSADHWLGTDASGRDVFSMFVYGARVSLIVGFAASLISVLIGTMVGLLAGYYEGWLGNLLTRLTDVFLVIPDLPLLVVLVALIGPSLWNIILAIGLFGWTRTARLVRAQVIALKERQFVLRARAIGASNAYIVRKHIFPLILPLTLANSVLDIALAILNESTLAFLGLGDPTLISWGSMLNTAINEAAISTGAWWIILPPGLGIIWLVLSWTLIGYILEELVNPRLKTHHLM